MSKMKEIELNNRIIRVMQQIGKPTGVTNIVEAITDIPAIDVKLAILRLIDYGTLKLNEQWEIFLIRKHTTQKRSYYAPEFILDCPFCGLQQLNDPDTLRDTLHPVTRSHALWSYYCPEWIGGCGATVVGYSPEDTMKRWNTRKTR